MTAPQTHPANRDMAWAAPARLCSGLNLRHPIIAAASDGQLSIVWEQNRVLMHIWRDNDTWQTPIRLVGGFQPVAVYDAQGSLHAAFVNTYSGNNEIYYTTWDRRSWSLPLNISHTNAPSTQPYLFLAPDGGKHIVWGDLAPGYSTIYHGWQRSGWQWENHPIPHAAGRRPVAAFDASGRLHLAYQSGEDDLLQGDIYYTCLENGNWSSPQIISSGRYPAGGVDLAVDRTGAAHVIWRERRPDADIILYASGQPHSWPAPQAVSPPLDRGAYPALALSTTNSLHAAWDHTEILEHSSCNLLRSTWAPTALAAAEFYRLGRPSLTADVAGRVHAVWLCQMPRGQAELHYTVRRSL